MAGRPSGLAGSSGGRVDSTPKSGLCVQLARRHRGGCRDDACALKVVENLGRVDAVGGGTAWAGRSCTIVYVLTLHEHGQSAPALRDTLGHWAADAGGCIDAILRAACGRACQQAPGCSSRHAQIDRGTLRVKAGWLAKYEQIRPILKPSCCRMGSVTCRPTKATGRIIPYARLFGTSYDHSRSQRTPLHMMLSTSSCLHLDAVLCHRSQS